MNMKMFCFVSLAAALTACGGGGGGSADPVVVVNVAPVANAGSAQSATTGATVTLDGIASSDANGDPLTYAWVLSSKPAGSAATLSSATAGSPSFVADLAGDYALTLTVNDGKVDSATSTVHVAVTAANIAPVANAGTSQFLVTGAAATLNAGASSDANGDTLSYRWTLSTRPAGSSAALTGASSARPSFVADRAGTYVASLAVNDGKIDSTEATVSVTAVDPRALNVPYVAGNTLTVKLIAFTATALSDGSVNYIAKFSQENHTAVAVDQIAPRLFFANADPVGTSDLPGQVKPGFVVEAFSIYNVAGGYVPLMLQYDASADSNVPVIGALQWMLPLP